MSNSGRTALIVGAGIGGLSAALALRQAGWCVRVMVRASDTGIYWFLSLANAIAPATRDARMIVDAMAAQFDDTFRSITSMTDEMRVDELYDRDPLPYWGKGHVTLLGDAAHPLLPQTEGGESSDKIRAQFSVTSR